MLSQLSIAVTASKRFQIGPGQQVVFLTSAGKTEIHFRAAFHSGNRAEAETCFDSVWMAAGGFIQAVCGIAKGCNLDGGGRTIRINGEFLL